MERDLVRIAVSACLLGEPCRYDGRAKPCARVQELASRGHELVPVCPEMAGGLPTPRTPCEVVRAPWMGASHIEHASEAQVASHAANAEQDARGAEDARASAQRPTTQEGSSGTEQTATLWKIVDANGADRTAAYERGARIELSRAREAGCELAVLKAKSPSCGSREVYDGTFSGALVPGQGIAAALFREAGIAVIDESADFDRL